MRRAGAIVATVAIAAAVAALGGRAMGLFAGKPPAHLGVTNGRLAPCPASPNCVASHAERADATHYVDPIGFAGDARAAWRALRAAVAGAERARIVADQDGYLRAEFVSRRMGFVDDVEFLLDAGARVIHVRSASRLGRRDFGVNRARIEALRAAVAARSA